MDPHIVDPDGHSHPMQRIHAKDEIKELQNLLHLNPSLLPGDQINPADPRRWLLVKREMPVPTPASGEDFWYIDFLYVDQSARPTFVECKLYRSTLARRAVVGQMMEYAANGQYYWTQEVLRGNAERAAKEQGQTLDAALHDLRPDDDLLPDAFFERVMSNLREGQLRLIFLLDDRRPELASIVEFLNEQMERSEVLLVEVRQFREGALRIAVPALYGYTEQARQIKRQVTVTSAPTALAGTHRKWDEARFFDDAGARLPPAQLGQVRAVYSYIRDSPYNIGWGAGTQRGSFGPRYEAACPRTLLTIWSDGQLGLNFGWYTGSAEADALRDAFQQAAVERLGLAIPAQYQSSFPTFSIQEWGPQAEVLVAVLKDLVRAPISAT